jgi:hypothetical protein
MENAWVMRAEQRRKLLCLRKVVAVFGAFAISCVPIGSAAAQSSKHSTTTKAAPKVQSATVCEPPAIKPIQSPQSVFSKHTVTLSWNASTPLPGRGKADGYCLYRSLKHGDAALGKSCNECELLNPAPLPVTTCVDTTVTDGPTYYYAVAAVNASGVSSSSSEVSAPIPADKPANSPPKGIRSCAGPNSSEKTTTPRKVN